MFVKPTHPNVPDIDRGGHLAPEGRDVEPTQYWLRRLQTRDVILADPPADGPAAAAPAQTSARAGRAKD